MAEEEEREATFSLDKMAVPTGRRDKVPLLSSVHGVRLGRQVNKGGTDRERRARTWEDMCNRVVLAGINGHVQ